MYTQTDIGIGQFTPVINIQKAIRNNRIYGRQLGWRRYYGNIVRLLGLTGWPSERAFAQAVARWQQYRGMNADGMLGPSTWVAFVNSGVLARHISSKSSYSLRSSRRPDMKLSDQHLSWSTPFTRKHLLGQIYFATDSAKLTPDDIIAIKALARAVDQPDRTYWDPDRFQLRFTGYADPRRPRKWESNRDLAWARAHAVQRKFWSFISEKGKKNIYKAEPVGGSVHPGAAVYKYVKRGKGTFLAWMRVVNIERVEKKPIRNPKFPPPKSIGDAKSRGRTILKKHSRRFTAEEVRHLDHILSPGTTDDAFLNGMDPKLIKIAYGLSGPKWTDGQADNFAGRNRVYRDFLILQRDFS